MSRRGFTVSWYEQGSGEVADAVWCSCEDEAIDLAVEMRVEGLRVTIWPAPSRRAVRAGVEQIKRQLPEGTDG